LNLYFRSNLNTTGRENAELIQEEVVRNGYAKNSKKEEEESKRRLFSDADLKQKRIALLGNNVGHQKYKKNHYDDTLKGDLNEYLLLKSIIILFYKTD
jgi:hypothetical protein